MATKKSFEISRQSIQMMVNAVSNHEITKLFPAVSLAIAMFKPKVDQFLEESPELYFRVTIEGIKK